MCSAGEGSLTAGMVLPGIQNGKPKYSVLTGWLHGTSRNGGSSYSSLCSPSFPLPLPISVLIIPPVKAKGEWGKKYITYILENSHSHPAWMKVEEIAGGLACACSSLTASCSLQGNCAKAVISCLVVGFPSPWGLKNGWGRALVKRHAAKLSLGTFHKPQANLLKHCSAPGHVQRVLGFSICGLINPSLHWVCLWRRDKSNLMQHSKSLKVWSAFCLRPSLCTSQTKGNWI